MLSKTLGRKKHLLSQHSAPLAPHWAFTAPVLGSWYPMETFARPVCKGFLCLLFKSLKKSRWKLPSHLPMALNQHCPGHCLGILGGADCEYCRWVRGCGTVMKSQQPLAKLLAILLYARYKCGNLPSWCAGKFSLLGM